LIPSGLGDPERPDWGGWGGRYERLSSQLGLWAQAVDQVEGIDKRSYRTPQATIWRWREAFQNDFHVRMEWSVTPAYADANHAPVVLLNDLEGLQPVRVTACPGQPVTLSATGSRDPDADSLSYEWWWYREASGLYAPEAVLSARAGEETKVTIADTARTDQFTPPSSYDLHVILEVKDNGVPPLTRYRRAIITVPGAGFGDDNRSCVVRPIPPSH
jgi:hypothetical protein